MKHLKNKVLVAAATMTMSGLSFAQGQFKLNDVKGTSGAGSKELKDLTVKGADTAQSFADFLLIGLVFVGVLLFGTSLYSLYKAQKEERESPKGAIWGLIIGICLTAVPMLLGLGRNFFSL